MNPFRTFSVVTDKNNTQHIVNLDAIVEVENRNKEDLHIVRLLEGVVIELSNKEMSKLYKAISSASQTQDINVHMK